MNSKMNDISNDICHSEMHNINNEHQHLNKKIHYITENILTIRSHSGISGDIFLTGLAVLAMSKQGIEPSSNDGDCWINEIACLISPLLNNCISIRRTEVHGIGGWKAVVKFPETNAHRDLSDIKNIINQSNMTQEAIEKALICFDMLAECESQVHNKTKEEIHFHEVGALDSILDICMTCELFERLHISRLICSPLPISDGQISCKHGILPAPAPATLQLLTNVATRPFAGGDNVGELITPTGIALLRSLNCVFGAWPELIIKNTAIIYGQKVFERANGVIFALGETLSITNSE